MNFPFYIAQRIYNYQGDHRRVSRPAIRIATFGIAIGLAVMITTVSVVIGFKHTIRDKVVGFGSHIRIENFVSGQSPTPQPICIDDSLIHVLRKIKGIRHVERYAITQGILKTDADFMGLSFKGIGEEYDTTFLHQNIIEGTIPQVKNKRSSGHIILSHYIANKLQLKVGDHVYAYFINADNVRTRKFAVSGIYQTNMSLFDQALCFTDIHTIIRLNQWESDQCSGAEVLVDNFDELRAIDKQLIEQINRKTDKYGDIFTSVTIEEAYPQIFTWLELLDVNVWIILILMICVAGFTIISGLLIIILERTQMIGLMKALGCRNSIIRHTFMWFSTFIVLKGLLWGNLIGIGCVLLQEYFHIVRLDPVNYYVSTAPVEINVGLIALINITTFVICLLVLVMPSYLISYVHPARSIRYE